MTLTDRSNPPGVLDALRRGSVGGSVEGSSGAAADTWPPAGSANEDPRRDLVTPSEERRTNCGAASLLSSCKNGSLTSAGGGVNLPACPSATAKTATRMSGKSNQLERWWWRVSVSVSDSVSSAPCATAGITRDHLVLHSPRSLGSCPRGNEPACVAVSLPRLKEPSRSPIGAAPSSADAALAGAGTLYATATTTCSALRPDPHRSVEPSQQ